MINRCVGFDFSAKGHSIHFWHHDIADYQVGLQGVDFVISFFTVTKIRYPENLRHFMYQKIPD